jgi:hypothetical protein
MKPIVIIRAAALFSALITVSTTTAAALSCDCGDICMSTSGWWNRHADAIIELAKVTEIKEEQP